MLKFTLVVLLIILSGSLLLSNIADMLHLAGFSRMLYSIIVSFPLCLAAIMIAIKVR